MFVSNVIFANFCMCISHDTIHANYQYLVFSIIFFSFKLFKHRLSERVNIILINPCHDIGDEARQHEKDITGQYMLDIGTWCKLLC